jgi:hypothetical protein
MDTVLTIPKRVTLLYSVSLLLLSGHSFLTNDCRLPCYLLSFYSLHLLTCRSIVLHPKNPDIEPCSVKRQFDALLPAAADVRRHVHINLAVPGQRQSDIPAES